MSEEKIKIKAESLLFFLFGHNFYMSEDSLTVKNSESGLRGHFHLPEAFYGIKNLTIISWDIGKNAKIVLQRVLKTRGAYIGGGAFIGEVTVFSQLILDKNILECALKQLNHLCMCFVAHQYYIVVVRYHAYQGDMVRLGGGGLNSVLMSIGQCQ